MNRFEERRLRRVIAEAAASAFVKRNQRSKRRLQRIFEDVGQDIKTAFKGGPGAVRSFVDSAKDKEGLKAALKGDFDGKTEDDVVTKSGGNPTVGSLLPTQSEIDLVKSIGWPLGDLTTLEKMIKSGTSTAPGAITVSGNLILDGHHRWSGVWSISGPSGKVAVDDLKIPGSTSQKLAASQLAIAAYKDAGAQQPSASDPIDLNILGKSPDEIEKDILAAEGQKDPDAPGAILNPQYLKACSESDTVAAWAGFKVGDDVEKVKAAIAKKTASNLAGLPKNPDAPARADMPQFDAKSIGGKAAKKAIFAGLEKGEYNIEPPFKPGDEEPSKDEKKQQTSGYRRDGHVVVERWQRLAGIIKG